MSEKKNYNLITPSKLLNDRFIILSKPYSYPGHFYEGKMIPCMKVVDDKCFACETKVPIHNRHSFGIFNIDKNSYCIMCCSDLYVRKINTILNLHRLSIDPNLIHQFIIYNEGIADSSVKRYRLSFNLCKTDEQKKWCDEKLKKFDVEELIYLVSNGPSSKIKNRMRSQLKTMLLL